MGPAEPDCPVYSALGSAVLGRRQNSRTGQKSRAGDPCGSSAGNLPVCGQQKFVGKKKQCPGAVAHACNPGTLGAEVSVSQGQEIKTVNMVKPHLY
ncbi:hypothetical protein AAY473_036035 [Plecturocebus cupreus]